MNTYNMEEAPEVKVEGNIMENIVKDISVAKSIDDLAKIKVASFELDEKTGERMEVHQLILKRFEQLITDKAKELLS